MLTYSYNYDIFISTKQKAVAPTKNEPPPIKKKGKGIISQFPKRYKTMENTRIYLNTWGAYNNGSIGYGWMTSAEAREFIEENPERDGGEWFIADIDNYLGIKISNCDYCDVMEVIDTIETLEDMEEYEKEEIIALMEYLGTESAAEAMEQKDRFAFYSDIDEYHDLCDELLDFSGCNEILERYFDFDAYHRDCDFDITEMSNGVCIAA